MTKKRKKQKEKKRHQEKSTDQPELAVEELSEWQKLNQEYLEKKAREQAEQEKEAEEQKKIRLEGEEDVAADAEEADADADKEETASQEEATDKKEADGEESEGDSRDTEEKETSEEDVPTLLSKEDIPEEDEEEAEQLSEKELKKQLKAEKKQARREAKAARAGNTVDKKHILRAVPIFLMSILVCALSIYFLTPYASLKEVTVSGNKEVSSKDILSASNIHPQDYTVTTFLQQKDHAQKITKSNPWIKETKLTYQFPITFKIKVKENTIVAYSYSAEQYYPVLSSGEELPTPVDAAKMPESFIRLDFSDKSMLRSFVQQLVVLPETVVANMGTVQHTPSRATPDLLTVNMLDGNTVLVPLGDLSKKLVYYNKIQGNLLPPSTVDMEVGIFSHLTTPPEKTEELETTEEELTLPQEDVN
ncbi:cell division protein FtsQ/DivIB [Streptococcus himalayensis]|uniref:Cell division protein DivIB n=1 Tax=Streptococcus himalayensis TaxID=1888195 RepID=A0A917A7V5_9STRE|nr:FtsQ-type POTRA domain-containing protein [Streptococcus himalayensis]GGE34185.1 cell division protein DivIB [Streptococcus himalayensis]